MANEFTIRFTLTYENGNAKESITPDTLQLPQVTQGIDSGIVTVNSSAEETLSFNTDVSTPSMLVLQSMEATSTGNFVTYGPDSTGMVPLGKLGPKHLHMIQLSSTGPTVKWQADTAAVNVRYWVFEQ